MERIVMTDFTIAFTGLGLIGGSTARTIGKTRPDIRIVAYTHSRFHLKQVRQEGIVDAILDGVDENLRKCDLIPLCTPIGYNAGYLFAIRPYLKQGTLAIDVGSTRCGIHEEIRRQDLEYCFVGGHPMTDSEKTGYENSTDHLLENIYYTVTPPEGKNSPCPQAPSFNTERTIAVARTIDAIPLVLDYREHDRVVATVSHLPHLVASSLVNLIKDHDITGDTMKQVAADGFKDITRIASSSPEMWEQICMTNVEPISNILEVYIVSLNEALEEIREHKGQDVYRLFEASRGYRDSTTDKAKESVGPSYEFTADVNDEVGVISTISVILAVKGIGIKNIGINNNHERGEGALKVAFYDKASMEATWQRLDKYKYEMFHM